MIVQPSDQSYFVLITECSFDITSSEYCSKPFLRVLISLTIQNSFTSCARSVLREKNISPITIKDLLRTHDERREYALNHIFPKLWKTRLETMISNFLAGMNLNTSPFLKSILFEKPRILAFSLTFSRLDPLRLACLNVSIPVIWAFL
jgi:hypothetical protein